MIHPPARCGGEGRTGPSARSGVTAAEGNTNGSRQLGVGVAQEEEEALGQGLTRARHAESGRTEGGWRSQSILLAAGHLLLGGWFQERPDPRDGNCSVISGGPWVDVFPLEKCLLVKIPLALRTHDLGCWLYFFLMEISIIANCGGFAASPARC